MNRRERISRGEEILEFASNSPKNSEAKKHLIYIYGSMVLSIIASLEGIKGAIDRSLIETGVALGLYTLSEVHTRYRKRKIEKIMQANVRK